jgi:methylase of polypeptide subunit release factors
MSSFTPPPATRMCRFGQLDVLYDERVLVPRPWTLMQSEWTAELAHTAPPGPILELCAGVGHIGLTAAALADRDLVQVELDPVAGNYAHRNAERAGRSGRVTIRVGPMAAALREDEQYPLIIADPPYLPSGDVRAWPNDPVIAIDGGADGLDQIRSCIDVGEQHLASNGSLLLQVAGAIQAEQVAALLADRTGRALRIVEKRVADRMRAVVRITHR